MPVGLAEATALAIVAPLSLQTRGSLLATNVDFDNVQEGKHDSDTDILDKRGRFDARRFAKVPPTPHISVHGACENQALAPTSVR